MQFPLERALTGISRAGFEYVELLSIPGIPGVSEHVRPEDFRDRDSMEVQGVQIWI